jgi:putative membrane protein
VRDQLIVMERRLLMITHIGAAGAVAFGIATLVWWLMHDPRYLHQPWLAAKLVLVAGLVAYHALSGAAEETSSRATSARARRAGCASSTKCLMLL